MSKRPVKPEAKAFMFEWPSWKTSSTTENGISYYYPVRKPFVRIIINQSQRTLIVFGLTIEFKRST